MYCLRKPIMGRPELRSQPGTATRSHICDYPEDAVRISQERPFLYCARSAGGRDASSGLRAGDI